jgi:hypothetical protein
VDQTTDRKGFRKLIDERALVFTRLPAGAARDLAAHANDAVGRGDGSLHTHAEYDALFDLLADGAETVPEAALAPYQPVLLDKKAFFAEPMYVVDVEGWPQDAPTLKGPATAPVGEMSAPLSPQVAEREVSAPAPEASGEVLAEASSQAAEREAPSPARQQAEQLGPAPAPDPRGEAETSAPAQVNGRALAAPDPLDEAPAERMRRFGKLGTIGRLKPGAAKSEPFATLNDDDRELTDLQHGWFKRCVRLEFHRLHRLSRDCRNDTWRGLETNFTTGANETSNARRRALARKNDLIGWIAAGKIAPLQQPVQTDQRSPAIRAGNGFFALRLPREPIGGRRRRTRCAGCVCGTTGCPDRDQDQ